MSIFQFGPLGAGKLVFKKCALHFCTRKSWPVEIQFYPLVKLGFVLDGLSTLT